MSDHPKLDLFQELMLCSDELFLWRYNSQMKLVESDSPHEKLLDAIFARCGFYGSLLKHAAASDSPLVLSISVGLVWIAVFEKLDGQLVNIHLIGPSFAANVLPEEMAQTLGRSYPASEPLASKYEIAKILEKLPVVAPMILGRYAQMLHYIVNHDKIEVSSIQTLTGSGLEEAVSGSVDYDSRRVWHIEEELLHKVRTGDLDYRSALSRANLIGKSLLPPFKDPLRQAKNTTLVFASLCTRASIEGGLSAEVAYALGNNYLLSAEACQSIADVAMISGSMFADFVQRVHQTRQKTGLSKAVRLCCDYIDFHIESKITLARLSDHTGLSRHYLSRQFKAEVGQSVSDYIRQAKVERAKMLLAASDERIDEIADRLGYASRNYFTDVFKAAVGTPPGEYRSSHLRA